MPRKSERGKKRGETGQVEKATTCGGLTSVERRDKEGENRIASKNSICGQKIEKNRTNG